MKDNVFFEQLVRSFHTPLTNPVLVFSLVLFIILLSPILLRRLNIPGIVGLIISGVIVGPHGLNFLAKNSAVDLFSTIGLLYIMFIAGLELDLNEFKRHKSTSLVFGILTFLLPLSLGLPVCYYLLKYNFDSSFLTASMFATHTLVAYPIVSRFGISKNKIVAITVGGTILTDTAVLIILAVIMGAAKGTLNYDFWIRIGTSLAIFSAIMFFLIPRVTKWFFKKLESEKTSHYIFVLSVVFFSAFLAQVAGVEPIIGAFVAGLALNKLIPNSSALMNRIEFIGNAIFIPFFLISVGMLVDVRVILSSPMALIVAGALTATAISGKWLAAFFMQKIFKYQSAERQLIFGLSAAHAAATLAIILVGYRAGILDENILNGTIILILITCLVASFVTESAAKKIVLNTDKELPADLNHNFKERVLLCMEDLSRIEALLELAVLIKDKRSPNPITILSVVPNNEQAEKNVLIAKKNLDQIRKLASATETEVEVVASIDHNVASGIVRTSKEIMADVIILDWPEKANIIDRVFGEKKDSIIANTDKNVFIYQNKNILIGHKRMLLLCPPFTELEKGFANWLAGILRLSKELSLPVSCYCNLKTKNEISQYAERERAGNITFNTIDNWDNFLDVSGDFNTDDILVVILARRGSVSYQAVGDLVSARIEKDFPENTKIFIYSRQYDSDNKFEDYEDMKVDHLNIGIEKIQRIGRGIGNILRNKRQ